MPPKNNLAGKKGAKSGGDSEGASASEKKGGNAVKVSDNRILAFAYFNIFLTPVQAVS